MDLFSEIRGKPQPDFDFVFGSSSGGFQGTPTKPLMGGDLLTPEAVGVHASMQQSPQTNPGLTTDVNTSLVRAAENLCELIGFWCIYSDNFVWLTYFLLSSKFRREDKNGVLTLS